MNFYNEDEKKDGAPAAPGKSTFKKASSFGKSPMFSRTAGGIMDRIKSLSRKDMAFVGIGLSILVLAPVAEYMMSKPSADNLLAPGFGSREGSAVSGLYEPGINALSQGSPDGSGEVITPLSSRDPASLILGSQPAAPVLPPPSAPENNFRDAMKDAGRSAFSEAARSAGAPTPIPRMQSALRSFGSFFSGGEGTRTTGNLSGGKIIDDAKSASGKAAKRSMMGPVAMPGYKGVASNTPNSSSRGAYEKLRSAADKSAGNFSGGSAMASLDKAAASALDIGAGGGGLGAGRESDKTTKPSGSTTKYDHNRSGETLAEMAAKQRQQKELDWEFFKKYEIPKQIINAMVGAVGGVLAEVVKGSMQHIFGMDGAAPKCWQPALCYNSDCNAAAKDVWGPGWWNTHELSQLCSIGGNPIPVDTKVGKESATSVQTYCVCGKGSKPLVGDNSGSGGSNTGPVTGPAVEEVDQISLDSAKVFEKYDAALGNVINKVMEVEKILIDGKPEAELKVQFAALGGAFDELGAAANGPVKNVLGNLGLQARGALNTYGGQISAKQEEYNKAEAGYIKYDAAVKKILADIADKKLRTNSEDGAKIDEAAGAETINQIIAAHEPNIKSNIDTAKGLLAAHSYRLNAYTKQLGVVDSSVGNILGEHAAVAPAANKLLAEAVAASFSEKLSAATGRPAIVVAAPDTAAPPARAGEAPGQGENAAPLRKAAEQLRAVDWEKLWVSGKREFDGKKAAKAEIAAWNEFDDAVRAKKEGRIAPPASFVANAARSGKIQAAAAGAGADFPNIAAFLATAEVHMNQAKKELANRVKPCYFADGGCSGGVTPGGPGDTVAPGTPVNTDALNGQVESLLGEYNETFDAANKIPSNTLVDPAHRPTYDSMAAAYQASPEYTGLKRDTARLGALQKELAGKVTADRAKAIEAEVGQIRGRLDSNRSGAMKGLVVLNRFVADHPYKPAGGGGTSNPPVVTPVTPVTPVDQPVSVDVLKLQVGTLLGHYNDAFDAANKIPSREKVAVKHRAAYDKKVAAYKASREYTALKADIARLTGFQKELTGKVTPERAKAIGAEVGRIRGRLSANKSGALYGLAMLKKFVEEYPYHGNGGSAQPTQPVEPVTPAKLESYPDAADAVEKAGDARAAWMNAKNSSDGALDYWRTEEDVYNKKLKLGKDDPFYGVKHPAYSWQLLSQRKRMNEAAADYKRLQPETDRAYQAYDRALNSARLLLNKYKLPLTYLPK